MPLRRKRRAPTEDEEEDEPTPRPSTQAATQRRRSSSAADADGSEDHTAATSQTLMVKSLIRLALATEYTRTPLRRAEITTKALDNQSRKFRPVFDAAQLALRETFGMELVELPAREKVTMAQKRNAASKAASQAQSQSTSSSSKSWVLCSVLPEAYRNPEIVGPSRAPDKDVEGAYVGLYTLMVATIALSGGRLPEARLERALKRMNAGETTPVDQTSKVLQKMEKQGYIVKIREVVSGEESVEYAVGSRGKVEIGKSGVAGLVKKVYGHDVNDDDEQGDLNKRLERSLKNWAIDPEEGGARSGAANGTNGNGSTSKRASVGKGQGKGKGRAAPSHANDDSSDDD